MHGYCLHIHLLLIGALVILAKEDKHDVKENPKSIKYNKEWQAVLKSYLPGNETYEEQKTLVTANKNQFKKSIKHTAINYTNSTESGSVLYTRTFKPSNTSSKSEITKKDIVFQINRHKNVNQRQKIDDPEITFTSNVGKATANTDSYQTIGDGVYFVRTSKKGKNTGANSASNKDKVKSIAAKFPSTVKTLKAIMGDLNRDDSDVVDVTKVHGDIKVQTGSLDNELTKTNSAVENESSSQTQIINNIEGVQPKELNLIKALQQNLNADDKNGDGNLDESTLSPRHDSLQIENAQDSISSIAKAVRDSDKDFIKNNPLAIDPESKTESNFKNKGSADQNNDDVAKEFFKNQFVDPDDPNAPTIPMYKKTLTETKPKEHLAVTLPKGKLQRPKTLASKFIDSVNDADNRIETFAGADKLDLDKDTSLDQRAKDIVNFAAQEDAQIMVGGSRSHKQKKRRRRRHHKKHISNDRMLKHQQTDDDDDLNTDEISKILKVNSFLKSHKEEPNKDKLGEPSSNLSHDESDTGFFMADENDIAALNKKTEDFVDRTINASLVDIIEPSTSGLSSKKDNLTTIEDSVVNALNTLTPEKQIKANLTELRKSKAHKIRKHRKKKRKLDKEDMELYKALNKTGIEKFNRHHSGSVWKVSKNNKPTKIIDVAGKPGVQIDLYITGNKGKKVRKTSFLKKPNTPKTTIQSADTSLIPGFDIPGDIEDVSLNELANNHEKQMYSSENQNNVGDIKDEVQNSHMEGNEGKPNSDASIQEAISSEELKDAMKDSDLKGLNEIKNEFDLQEAKNTVDFFNLPNSAKALTNHIDSTKLNDLTEQINEAEKGTKDAKFKDDNDPQKVKIILHIPEAMSKHKDQSTQEAINSLAEQAKAFLTTDHATYADLLKPQHKKKYDEATLTAAKKIEEFIKQEASREDQESREKTEGKQVEAIKEDEEVSENILNALLKTSNALHTTKPPPNVVTESSISDSEETGKSREHKPNVIDIASQLKEAAQVETKNEEVAAMARKNDENTKMMERLNGLLDVPKKQDSETFLENTHGEAMNHDTIKNTDLASSLFHSNQPLRINGGQVIGGNVQGGSILGGIISGGDVKGGEIRGGKIRGGSFRNGLFMDGVMDNGLIEGGKIKGGLILGGDIKSGIVEGGEVKGGVIDGGHLFNGTVDGGSFKGGEMYGGHLISGEMDGGILKNGSINGGILKGGVIESGSLDGGVMLSGTLRGGVVKSGIIKGGIIDKGVVVQDAEIGPGVEIHDGIVKGGRITVNSLPQVTGGSEHMFTPPVPETMHTDENRSNIMYTLEVLPKPTESFKASIVGNKIPDHAPIKEIDQPGPEKKKTVEKEKETVQKSLTSKKDTEKDLSKSIESKKTEEKHKPLHEEESKQQQDANQAIHEELKVDKEDEVDDLKNVHQVDDSVKKEKQSVNAKNMYPQFDNAKIQSLLSQLEATAARKEQVQQVNLPKVYTSLAQRRIPPPQDAVSDEQPLAHWELSESKNSVVKGNPGPKLRISGGVKIHNGHAILDGTNGYMDAGDYQGECFSDPEVCDNGFTIQMTVKIYRDSVFNTTRLFIVDSGAWSKDSRGISVYVSDGRIGGMVSTRRETWCIHKILEPYIEKWISLTITWRKDKGLMLYINCDLFDQSLSHSSSECDVQCTAEGGCHKTDVATRLMFGRPNKGPHFKVIHSAVGEISLYENFSGKDDVKRICGSKDNSNPPPDSAVASIIQQPQLPKAIITPPRVISSPISSFTKPVDSDEEGGFSWPTPSTIKKQHESVKHVEENPWPTPARLAPPKALNTQVKATEHPKRLIDPNTDRRSSLHDNSLDGAYGPWQEWSPCSQTCGKGVEISVRYCTHPAPKRGGRDCYHTGPPRKFKPCSLTECPGVQRRKLPHNEHGTKKSAVPNKNLQPLIIVNGQQKSLQELETAFEQLKHRRR